MPLCPSLWSMCLPVLWPVALEGTGTCHPASCLWELLQGTGPCGCTLEVQGSWKHGSLCWWGLGDLLPEASGDKRVCPHTLHPSQSATHGGSVQKENCLSPSYVRVSESWNSVLACHLASTFLYLSVLFCKMGTITYFKGLLGGSNRLRQVTMPATQ